MQQAYEGVLDHPKFKEMVGRRNRFSLILSIIVLGVFYTFVLIASTQPALFAKPLAEGGAWTVGLLAGWIIQMFAFLMTGVYVTRANGEFDAMNRAICEEVGR